MPCGAAMNCAVLALLAYIRQELSQKDGILRVQAAV